MADLFVTRETLAFSWEFYINGEKLSTERKRCITSVDYSNPIDASDMVQLSISDPDMIFIDDDLFVEDAKVKLEIFFEGSTGGVVFDGYIVAFDAGFPEDGIPLMTLYCMDNTHLMEKKKVKKTWKNKTRAQIIKEIAKKYGCSVVLEKGYTFRKVSSIAQSKVTDIEFCESLADNEPDLFYFKRNGNVFYFCKYKVADEYYKRLAYRKAPYDVLSFSPQITKAKIQVKEKDSKITPEYGDEWEDNESAEEYGIPGGADSPTGGYATVNAVYNHDTGQWEYIDEDEYEYEDEDGEE